MKKSIFFTAVASLVAQISMAQEDRMNISVFEDQDRELKISSGVRFITDAGYLSSDFTPLSSGAKISEARFRTGIEYKKWFLYADFEFGSGHFEQRNLFVRYNHKSEENNFQAFKLGYYAEPFSMGANTSRYALHFITRPSYHYSLSNTGRVLGASYSYANKYLFTNTGIFSENHYNNQIFGNQGFGIGGRYIFYPLKDEKQTLHLGASLRYATIRTGKVNEKTQILETPINITSRLENNIDGQSEFLSMEIPWADSSFRYGFEALYHNDKIFIRGEYSRTNISKNRPDEQLFQEQLGGIWSWQSLSSWQKGNPLENTKYSGGYVEAGYLIHGDQYSYERTNAVLNGLSKAGAVEVVARFSYLNLNDIKEGDIFIKGRNQFYPQGNIKDYPATSTSFAGGKSLSYTFGVNYTINSHAKVMLGYTYTNLDNPYFPYDKNINMVQARLMFAF